ncbi:MAG: nucleotidyltransferase domain-containing protein [Methanosarcinaceae archaeon]|nr:nucleotidyltransferase domain-containing protein [Methanosarcinaceae archaeon]
MTRKDAPDSAIKSQLACIARENDVRILLAVESGSRSWGFESPDSDYDVRFIYTHRTDWYLSIKEKRDVIELPFDGQLDICGWDLRKTLRLFKKSNPVLMECIVSPFVYLESGSFGEKIRTLAGKYYSRKTGAHHYLNMAESNHKTHIENREEVNLKKYFYVLRPLINILWLSEKKGLIPMAFGET